MCEYWWDQVMRVCFITLCCFLCLSLTHKDSHFCNSHFWYVFLVARSRQPLTGKHSGQPEWRSWLMFLWPLKHKHAHYFFHCVTPKMQQKLTEALICLFTYNEGYILLQGSPADLSWAGHLMAPRGTLTCCCVSFEIIMKELKNSNCYFWDIPYVHVCAQVLICGKHSLVFRDTASPLGVTPRHLVELRVVEKVGSVSVNQGAEGQAILPALPGWWVERTIRQFRRIDLAELLKFSFSKYLCCTKSTQFSVRMCPDMYHVLSGIAVVIYGHEESNEIPNWWVPLPDMEVLNINIPVGGSLSLAPQK